MFVIRQNVQDNWNTDELTRMALSPRPMAELMGKLAGAISTDEMRKLNYEVDGAKRDKKIVVHEWLVKKGFVTPG